VQLAPNFFPLMKSTSFPNYFSENIISVEEVPAFLQAFKVVISCPTTEHWTEDLGRGSCNVIEGHASKHSRDVWLGFERFENIFGVFVLHILSKTDKIVFLLFVFFKCTMEPVLTLEIAESTLSFWPVVVNMSTWNTRSIKPRINVNGINLLAFYQQCRSLIGYATHYLFWDG